MHKARVGIFGASGYAGLELVRLLAGHSHALLAFAASEKFIGRRIDDLAPGLGGGMQFVGGGQAAELAAGCTLVLFATPPEPALELAPRLVAAGVKVIDLSNAFRLAPETATYGLPELGDRAAISAAKLVANPGCYPTAATLALGPLLRARAIAPTDLIVDAMSGVTGAGRRADEAYSFVELEGNAKPYKVLRHQHAPEIAAVLARYAGEPVDLTFTPHLIPIARGILSTAYARAARPTTSAELTQILRAAYEAERFVRVVDSPDEVSIARVVRTNTCVLGVACEGTRVVVVSAIDNLVKGAAGQAIQNMNLMLGLPEETAL